MKSKPRILLQSVLAASIACCAASYKVDSLYAQTPKSIELSTESESGKAPQVERLKVGVRSPLALGSIVDDASKSPAELSKPSDDGSKVIRERFPNGRVRIERQVILDAGGNFVNHGDFQELNSTGEMVSGGQYEMGAKQGPWMRLCQAKDSKLFEVYPFNKLKSPFKSTVEFSDGKMNGVWLIVDSENRVACQIPLEHGIRTGQVTFFHPTGQLLYQAEYRSGILNGQYIEKDAAGKIVRQDLFANGQKTEKETEHFPTTSTAATTTSKRVKFDAQFLSPILAAVELDKWETATLATYTNQGERIKHGPFAYYHENGQLKNRGTYERGVLTGEFESWFSNGQREATGTYVKGTQAGSWEWWHSNGMPKAIANYDKGQLVGNLQAWNADGRRATVSGQALQPTLTREAKADPPASSRKLR